MRDVLKNLMNSKPIPKAHVMEEINKMPVSTEISCIIALVLIVTGVAFVIFTDYMNEIFPFVLGINLIFLGIADSLRGIRTKEYRNKHTKLTSNGIVFALLGTVIIMCSEDAHVIVSSIWGTMGLIKGGEELNKAMCLKSERKSCLKELTSAALELILGFLLLRNPGKHLHHHIVVLGMELMLTGVKYIMRAINDRELRYV